MKIIAFGKINIIKQKPMNCSNCQNPIADGEKLCGKCGSSVGANIPSNSHLSAQSSPQPTESVKRLANFLLDGFFIFVFSFIFAIPFGVTVALSGLEIEGKSFLTSVLNYLFNFSSILFFYVLFETIWGKTPAKWITKTKVVMRDGSKPSFGRVLIRTLARFIPFDPLSFCFNKNPIGWHDKLSKTIVVDDKRV